MSWQYVALHCPPCCPKGRRGGRGGRAHGGGHAVEPAPGGPAAAAAADDPELDSSLDSLSGSEGEPLSKEKQLQLVEPELQVEETNAYKEKVSRWKSDVLKATADIRLWITIQVIHTCRAPLDHFFGWLSKAKAWSGQFKHQFSLGSDV